jgi:hypothetical protein
MQEVVVRGEPFCMLSLSPEGTVIMWSEVLPICFFLTLETQTGKLYLKLYVKWENKPSEAQSKLEVRAE